MNSYFRQAIGELSRAYFDTKESVQAEEELFGSDRVDANAFRRKQANDEVASDDEHFWAEVEAEEEEFREGEGLDGVVQTREIEVAFEISLGAIPFAERLVKGGGIGQEKLSEPEIKFLQEVIREFNKPVTDDGKKIEGLLDDFSEMLEAEGIEGEAIVEDGIEADGRDRDALEKDQSNQL